MKKITIYIFALIFTGLLSCTKDELPAPNKKANASYSYVSESRETRPVIKNLPGDYRILFFVQNNQDHSQKFKNATITFKSDGILIFNMKDALTTGTWYYDSQKMRVVTSLRADLFGNAEWAITDLMQCATDRCLLLEILEEGKETSMKIRKIEKVKHESAQVLTFNE